MERVIIECRCGAEYETTLDKWQREEEDGALFDCEEANNRCPNEDCGYTYHAEKARTAPLRRIKVPKD